jgi:putative methyltransferase (TIGR04325 family)
MVSRGREIALRDDATRQLEFVDRFAEGDGAAVLYASGVLQYLPARLYDMLSGYKSLPRRIIINTAAIHPQREFFTVNSIGTAFCPYRIQTEAALMRGLGELGYSIREKWVNPGKLLTIPFQPENSLEDYSGYCLDLAKKP